MPCLSCDCRKYLPPCQPQNRYGHSLLLDHVHNMLSVISLVSAHVSEDTQPLQGLIICPICTLSLQSMNRKSRVAALISKTKNRVCTLPKCESSRMGVSDFVHEQMCITFFARGSNSFGKVYLCVFLWRIR